MYPLAVIAWAKSMFMKIFDAADVRPRVVNFVCDQPAPACKNLHFQRPAVALREPDSDGFTFGFVNSVSR